MTKLEFHQHPDGWIIVRTAKGVYLDTRENFEKDSGKKLPALPAGASEEIYTVGVRHAYMGDGNVVAAGPRQWDWGDEVIAMIGRLLGTQTARKKVEEEVERKRVEQEAKAIAAKFPNSPALPPQPAERR